MGEYVLRCLECGMRVDDAYTNRCPRGCDALLVSEYKTNLKIRCFDGICRFYDWLPVLDVRKLIAASRNVTPVTYKSGIGKELGLHNLYVSFNGFWPERGAFMRSCTFKELEAICTLVRAEERTSKTLVVASAGNTARSFAQVFSAARRDVVLVVPSHNIQRVWTTVESPSRVFLISLRGDYTDAIKFAAELSACSADSANSANSTNSANSMNSMNSANSANGGGEGKDGGRFELINEGGVRNVARRDGLGVVILDALIQMKRIDHYFQAVGSGVGAIGVYEMAFRASCAFSKRNVFSKCGAFSHSSKCIPKLHLAQNLPFAPMFHAWKAGRSTIKEEDMPDAERSIKAMYADVLSNRNPPYSIRGGVYDVLSATGGEMYGITKNEAKSAKKMFECVEGIDIDPAAAVAVAALVKAVECGNVNKDDYVLLNITGGGYQRLNEEHFTCLLHKMNPIISADPKTTPVEDVLRELKECMR